MYNNEVVFNNHENGMKVARILLEEGYVVMLSYEEQLFVVNWEWCPSDYPDRNDVIFMSREVFEEKYCEIVNDEEGEE